MRNFKTEGIIIKRRNYKDSDRVLTVLTKTHGKIYVRAAGVRKITSRRAGHIEPLNHCVLTLYQGHAFPVLTEAETISNFSMIKQDLESVGLALHLCELVDGLCPENQENFQVFSLLEKTLKQLSVNVIPDHDRGSMDSRLHGNDKLVQEFEMQLLTILGYSNKANFLTLPEPDQTGLDRQNFIENLLERKLKSRHIFAKLQQ